MPGPNIRFVNRGSKRGEIWLYDQVGEGFFGGMSAMQFVSELRALGQVDVINLRINSPGGSIQDGIAIHNTLKAHPARVEVDVDSMAASIASVIAMAGDEIRIASNAQMMIHDPHGVSMGPASEMRKTAEILDALKQNIVDTYVARTGAKAVDVAEMMLNETWMNASKAVALGFADAVTDEQRIEAVHGSAFAFFKHTPQEIVGGGGGMMTPRRDQASVKLVHMNSRIAALPA